MQRPPRLSVVDAVECDDEAATCSARDSRAILSRLDVRPPARSGVSYIEDSDVISSIGPRAPESVTNFAARPSYVARGEIVTSETRTYSPPSVATVETLDSADFEHFDLVEEPAVVPERAVLGMTREEPLVAPDPRSFAEAEPAFVGSTMLMPPSVRPVYRSRMISVPAPPDSCVESPWVLPSVRGASFAPPAPARDLKNVLQTIAIIGTGILMLAIVFGAVLFARSDSDEQQAMQFSPQRMAAQPLPLPIAAPVAPVPAPTMQVISAPLTSVTAPVVVKVHTAVAATPHVKELLPKSRVDGPKLVTKAEKPEPSPKKTKEEESVEALLKKLGEEQLSR